MRCRSIKEAVSRSSWRPEPNPQGFLAAAQSWALVEYNALHSISIIREKLNVMISKLGVLPASQLRSVILCDRSRDMLMRTLNSYVLLVVYEKEKTLDWRVFLHPNFPCFDCSQLVKSPNLKFARRSNERLLAIPGDRKISDTTSSDEFTGFQDSAFYILQFLFKSTLFCVGERELQSCLVERDV